MLWWELVVVVFVGLCFEWTLFAGLLVCVCDDCLFALAYGVVVCVVCFAGYRGLIVSEF